MGVEPINNLNGIAPEERLTYDPVTGLRNEHLFRLRLPDEFFKARERETNAALLAIKIDRIVEINSRLGRQAGDEALLALAQLLKQIQAIPGNENHLLFKLAGPVFGYFIPSCSAEQAAQLAERIVQETSLGKIFLERLTVSIGVVNLYEFFLYEGSPAQIARTIEETAIKRVTVAEKSGGNSVCLSSELKGQVEETRPRVLIIDPDQASLELLSQAFQVEGFEVLTCRNGEEAFALIQAQPPHLIICEVLTPRLDGFMLKDRLRSNVLLAKLPFILISHKKTDDFIRQALVLDIRFYFRKPLSLLELTGLAKNLLKDSEHA